MSELPERRGTADPEGSERSDDDALAAATGIGASGGARCEYPGGTRVKALRADGLYTVDLTGDLISSLDELKIPPITQRLVAVYCSRLCCIGDLSQCQRLQSVDVSHCLSLFALAGLPPSVRTLTACHCPNLFELCDLTSLLALRELNITGSAIRDLPLLPDSVNVLRFAHCENLRSCQDLPTLLNLEELDASGTDVLFISPLPRSLKKLCVAGCSSFRGVDDVAHLEFLTELDVSYTGVTTLAGLPWQLKRLDASHCYALNMTGDLTGLKCLQSVSLDGSNINTLQGLPSCVVQLSAMATRVVIADLASFTALKRIYLSYNSGLLAITGPIAELEVLEADHCPALTCIGNLDGPATPCSSPARHFSASFRLFADSLPSLPDMSAAVTFRFSAAATALEALPELPRMIQRLNVSQCRKLCAFGDLASLQYLEVIDISRASLKTLPPLPSSVRVIKASDCTQLAAIPEDAFEKLSSLQRLDLSRTAISKLPSSLPPSLQAINLSGCSRLASLPASLSELKHLRVLDISRTAIKSEPILSHRGIILRDI